MNRPHRPTRFPLKPIAMALMSAGIAGTALGGPQDGVVRAGVASITTSGPQTRIQQSTDRAVIDWRSFGIGAAEQVLFQQPGALSATLNRVTGDQVSVLLGRLDANGRVVLVNPNGVLIGGGAQINVGSFIASTANVSNANFMAGRLLFDQPGKPGAEIVNAGSITAAEGGLVALVAPHVRNDGLIQARLGKVVLGAADTFTIDLYGDELVSLALSDVHAGAIAQAGTIDVGGGRAVLVTAATAKNVLDNVINMSGTIKADSAVAQGGKILLLAAGGSVDVSGTLSANGATGGGTIHVGGGFQGAGDYRAQNTNVEAGATLRANATGRGNGGEVVVWSDVSTSFAGEIQAKGGPAGGNGGRMEVSSKGTLAFLGTADASAPAGAAGSLLLDPAILDIGLAEAGLISRVLRTGTSTTLAADIDINVNSLIDGRGRIAGGGLTMTAGNNINVNDFVLTNNGAINLFATGGTVNVAAGKAVFAGTAPITVQTGGTLHTGPFLTGGMLSLRSTAGAVAIDTFIDGGIGRVDITAATDVNVNQPIVNLQNGSPLNVSAGNDVNINAQVDGRGGAAGGAATFVASRNVNVNDFVVTNNGAISVTATNGAATVAAGKGLFSGTAPLSMTAKGNVTSGVSSSGSLALTSTAGAVEVNGLIDGATGAATISAATDVNINQPVLNLSTGNPLTVTAGQDIHVNAQIDGRGGVAGGSVALTAARNVGVNDFVVTNNGAIDILASNGTASVAAGKALVSGTAPVSMRAQGDLTTGASSSGALTLASIAGAVTVAGLIDGNTKAVNISAGTDVNINQPALNMSTGNPLNVSAGQDINVNAQIDGRGGLTGGAATLSAGRNVAVNESIVTNSGAISLTATTGAVTVAAGKGLFSGTGPVSVNAAGNVTNGAVSAGTLTLASASGSISLNGVIDSATGRVDINAGADVNVSQPVLNLHTGNPLNVTAGRDINVNVPIDGRGGVAGGALTLDAGRNVNANQDIATQNGAIGITAHTGTVVTAAGKGVYAGSGPIAMTSGGTLSTGLLSTTGTITAQSTAGSLNVNAPIDATAGAITLAAAGAVNLNQPLANPRTSAALSVTAGTDINVNSPIDVRDASPQNPSGTVTLTAGQNVNLNQDVVTNNAAINVTAQAGTLVTAASKGLYSGTAPISVTTGATLNTGITSTTGALNLASTAGSVNVGTPISDTTGAVTINAAGAVNVNQPITSIKTGNPLVISAGTDLNVNAQIDGRSGTASGGGVSLSAGNNLRLFDNIVTNDGPINLTTIAGSVFLAPVSQDANLLILAAPKQVRAGSAPITIVSGGDFSTGAPPPQPIPTPPPSVTTEQEAKDYVREFLKQYVQLVTTGALSITSTHGNVNVIAPIPDTTGPVTITAGNTINVKHKINSDNQPIVLNGGTGGIHVFAMNDSCVGTLLCNRTSPLDARMANLTLNSLGDVTITGSGVATAKTLTIDTRARILSGSVGTTTDGAVPAKVVLNADQGIVNFSTSNSPEVFATSIGGSINLGVFIPGKLRITTGTPDPNNPTVATDCTTCDIHTGGYVGPDVVLNAGGSVNLDDLFASNAVTLIARAGDVNLRQVSVDNTLTVSAGRDVKLNAGGCSSMGLFGDFCGVVWIGPKPGSGAASGPLSMTAGRDIITDAFSPIHLSNAQALTLTAGRNVTLNLLETLGSVSLTASTGSITANNPIGPAIVNGTNDADFNPSNLGVASLTMSAPTGPITMTGARAQGDVTISTGGSLTSSRQITSVSGAVSISAGSQSITNTAIGSQNQLFYPGQVLGVVSPGPSVPPPLAPGIASVPGAGLPLLAEIAVVDQPGLSGGSAGAPGTSSGGVALPTAPTGAGGPGPVGAAALPGAPAGSGEEGVDTSAAQRAAQGTSTETTAREDATIVALAAAESEEQSVLCPAGVAPGSPVKKKDANGKEVTVKCK